MGSLPDEGAFKILGAVWGFGGHQVCQMVGVEVVFLCKLIHRTKVEMKCGRLFGLFKMIFYGFYHG